MFNVSRSVERAFEVLELFQRLRRPLLASDVRRELGLPHSSTVVLLTHMSAIGCLEQDPETRTYRPGHKLRALAAWTGDGADQYGQARQLMEQVFAQVGETTSICKREGLFCAVVDVRRGEHPDAVDLARGYSGTLLMLSVVGRTLLSALPDTEVRELVAWTNRWARTSRLGLKIDPDTLVQTVRQVRAIGHLYDCNLLLPDVGAVSFPLRLGTSAETLALTIAARTDRMERRGARIIRQVTALLEGFGASSVAPRPGMTASSGSPVVGRPWRVVDVRAMR